MLDQAVKDRIQKAYRHILKELDLKPRYGQRLMIAEIAKTLAQASDEPSGQKGIAVIEAGTGTGKTLAYTLATLPIAQAKEKKIVLSTATIALQEQIIHKDLPAIRKNADLPFTYALAKGRARYLCLHKLDQIMQENAAMDISLTLFEQEKPDQFIKNRYEKLLNDFAAGKWDGDRDNLADPVENDDWRSITSTHRECSNRRCPHFDNCAFFEARKALDSVDIVVANHDLVLADLHLGGGAILPAPADTIYVFDEGHHLAEKAVSHFSASVRIKTSETWLKQLNSAYEGVLKDGVPANLISVLGVIPKEVEGLKQSMSLLFSQCQDIGQFEQIEFAGQALQKRFEQGAVPEPLRVVAKELSKHWLKLLQVVERLVTELSDSLGKDDGDFSREQAENWHPIFGQLLGRIEVAEAAFQLFSQKPIEGEPPVARWLSLIDTGVDVDIEISSSPVLAADLLAQKLWYPCYGAVLTSATLTALGNFDRIKYRSGLGNEASYHSVPSPFDYSKACLHVPNMKSDPGKAEEHTSEIIERLPGWLPNEGGGLVLFSSRRQMQGVMDGLPKAWQDRILVQGHLSKQETLTQHRERIDSDKPSILFGLASFAEGIDLPGKYLVKVIIAKIPFTVPNDPVEATLAEWLESQGRNPFMELSVPDACIRLVQACGRLLRTESDKGDIMLLDRRVVTRRYGKSMLDALPPFRRQIDY
jgi:ATP-dependent DNA helicase DinG